MRKEDFIQVKKISPQLLMVDGQEFKVKLAGRTALVLIRDDGTEGCVRKDYLFNGNLHYRMTPDELSFLQVDHTHKCFNPVYHKLNAKDYVDN